MISALTRSVVKPTSLAIVVKVSSVDLRVSSLRSFSNFGPVLAVMSECLPGSSFIRRSCCGVD